MHPRASSSAQSSKIFWFSLTMLFIMVLVLVVVIDQQFPTLRYTQVEQSNDVSSLSPSMRQIYEDARSSSLRIEIQLVNNRFWGIPLDHTIGIGTGFFISADGLALTAYHVIDAQGFDKDAFEIIAVDTEGERYRMDVVGFDAYADLALLQVARLRGRKISYLPLSTIPPRIGDEILTIGNSNGDFLAPRTGQITDLDVEAMRADFASGTIELNAKLDQGDSGAPVLNGHTEVIGVVSYISFIPEDVLERNRRRLPPMLRNFLDNNLNIYASYAVPVGQTNSVIQSILEGEQRDVPVVGIRGSSYTPSRNPQLRTNLGRQSGALVASVEEDGPADAAGLRNCRVFLNNQHVSRLPCDLTLIDAGYTLEADVIIAVDNESVRDFNDMIRAIRRHNIGDTVTLTIIRDSKEEKITLTLGAREDVF